MEREILGPEGVPGKHYLLWVDLDDPIPFVVLLDHPEASIYDGERATVATAGPIRRAKTKEAA